MQSNIAVLFFFLLNYFWLSMCPVESASWYSDAHCFKIGSELVETIWDAAVLVDPPLEDIADSQNLPKTYRRRRHSKPGCMAHPLVVWTGLCRANFDRQFENAEAIFQEHLSRTCKSHSAWEDLKWLRKHTSDLDFHSDGWAAFYASQNGSEPATATKTKKPDLLRRREWVERYVPYDISKRDRNATGIENMTEPPQCINENLPDFQGCQVFTACGTFRTQKQMFADAVAAYRKYYIRKASTVHGGFRYFYSTPPDWLILDADAPPIKTSKKSSSTKKSSTPVRPVFHRLIFSDVVFVD